MSGARLFCQLVTNFWTPHSSRAYLPSATHVLSFPKEDRHYPRGWAAQASDRFARTARWKIVNMQRAVVQRIQDKDASRLAEEESSLLFREFLASKGLSVEVVKASVLRLADCFERHGAAQEVQQELGDADVEQAEVPVPEVEPRELLSRLDKKAQGT